MVNTLKGPLDGVRVVEIASVVLGPYACQMLGDMGADVIKIEPLKGDSNRNVGPYAKTSTMTSLYLGCNRNKRSVSLDLKSDEGLAAAFEIIKTADVMLHNFRPGTIARLGLGYQSVKAINPEIVYCGAYGYSKRGPDGDKGALDDSIQAASGIAMLQASITGAPGFLPTVVADKATAMNVVQAVLAALFHKQRSGEGQEIEVPMYESMVSFVMVEHLWGQSFEPAIGKAGYVRLLTKHRKPYRTKDQSFIALLPYWDQHWKTFCELAGHPVLATDARFIDMHKRLENIDDWYCIIEQIIAEKTQSEWVDLLDATSVPMMIVKSLEDLITDPQLTESEFWHEAEHPTEGRLRMPNSPLNFSKTPTSIRQLPPHLGEHTAEVLEEVGMSQQSIKNMLANGTAKSQ
jgi:crotonobetainyl-CoA:carnitine CoA-transferase CaiB-like acyl-CoA transferase